MMNSSKLIRHVDHNAEFHFYYMFPSMAIKLIKIKWEGSASGPWAVKDHCQRNKALN